MEGETPVHLVEILAPGGDEISALAAINAGANAVYLGLGSFNARMRADNFDLPALQRVCAVARNHGCRIYLTVNVLVTDPELPQVMELCQGALQAGISACIVQDLGLARVLHQRWPLLELHASTQLTTHNSLGIRTLSTLGFSQINLSRELSLHEIEVLTKVAHECGVKTEVFVHGAYCISFSGQCWLSAMETGLSGNRGQCVQGCRRQWSSKGQVSRPLHLKDNNALHLAKQLLEVGVDSFKIEGRRKGPAYVDQTVRSWVAAVQNNQTATADVGMVFNRGFSSAWLDGTGSRTMFTQETRDQSLQYLGIVEEFSPKSWTLKTSALLRSGMTINVEHASGDFLAQFSVLHSEGGNVWKLAPLGQFKGKVVSGDHLYLIPGAGMEMDISTGIKGLLAKKNGLSIRVSGSIGQPLSVAYALEEHSHGNSIIPSITIRKNSKMHLEPSRGQEATRGHFKKILTQVGGNPWIITDYNDTDLALDGYLSPTLIKELRRTALEELQSAWDLAFERSLGPVSSPTLAPPKPSPGRYLGIIVDSQIQFKALIQGFSPEEIKQVIAWLRLPSQGGLNQDVVPEINKGFYIPPIVMEGDIVIIQSLVLKHKSLLQGETPLILNDNLGFASWLHDNRIPYLAGPRLGICNTKTMESFASLGGGGVLSPELSTVAIEDIARGYRGGNLGLIVYSPLYAMQTRQCLIRSSSGCPKNTMDDTCLAACSRNSTIVNKEGEGRETVYEVIKTPGNYNTLWHSRPMAYPKDPVEIIRLGITVPILDFRLDAPFKPSLNQQISLTNYLLRAINGKQQGKDEWQNCILSLKPGNGMYQKGLGFIS